ncbi:unnamed protein product [Leuciscus chuanchicus]
MDPEQSDSFLVLFFWRVCSHFRRQHEATKASKEDTASETVSICYTLQRAIFTLTIWETELAPDSLICVLIHTESSLLGSLRSLTAFWLLGDPREPVLSLGNLRRAPTPSEMETSSLIFQHKELPGAYR